MSKSKIYFKLIVLLDVVLILIASGSFFEIKGIIVYCIFCVPVVLNILFLKKYRKTFYTVIICIILFIYLATGVIFLIREDSRKVISQKKNNRYTYVTYEINSGAMGHFSYEDRIYYSLIDTDLLTVNILKNSTHYQYMG